jgi:hypothetical protein
LNAYSYQNVFPTGAGSGKLFVPVRPSMVIHAQFDHISGVPATPGQGGVSVSKIQILNALIDQLVSLKAEPATAKITQPASDNDTSELIRVYQDKLQNTLKASVSNRFLLPGAAPQIGQLFSIQA